MSELAVALGGGYVTEGFDAAVATMVAAGQTPLEHGVNHIDVGGHGRSAVFTVSGPANVTVDAGASGCTVYYYDRRYEQWDESYCDEKYRVRNVDVIGVVSGGHLRFTGLAPSAW